MALDYSKTRAEATQRKEEISVRLQEVAAQRRLLDDEELRLKRETIGLDQILEGAEMANSETPPDLETPTLTKHIREILQKTTVPLLPTQIRDSCIAVGITGSSMKNLLISVHTVIDRLGPQLEERQVEGKKAYIWRNRNRYADLAAMAGLAAPPADAATRALAEKLGETFGRGTKR
jgi:hypothetical protein